MSPSKMIAELTSLAESIGFRVLVDGGFVGRLSMLHGFCIWSDGYPLSYRCIFINANDSKNEQSFTIAHEIGHVVLDHLSRPSVLMARGKAFFVDDEAKEREADDFAVRLISLIAV